MKTIQIYTDGSCSNNGQKDSCGGGAFIVINSDEICYRESFGTINTTNQKMELESVARACEWAIENFPFDTIEIFTDSAYIINCFKQNWWKNWERNGWKNSKKEEVANVSLWKRIIPYFSNSNFIFTKVKGHAGIKYNELVDKMAVEGNRMAKLQGGKYESTYSSY